MGSITKASTAVLALALAACAPMAASFQDGTPVTKKEDTPIVAKDELACLDDKIDFDLRVSVNRFEMSGGSGANAGFNPGGLLQLIGLNVTYDSGDLNTSMSLYQAFKTKAAIANGEGVATKSSFGFGLNFLAGLFNGGFNFYSQTPVFDLSKDALTSNLGTLVTDLKKYMDPWSTNIVTVMSETEFIIPVGKNAGLVDGDELKIMAATYEWVGSPCESDLRMMVVKPEVLAIATVSGVTFDNAHLVLKAKPKVPIEKHALVMISKLLTVNKIARTDLKRSVRVGRVSSQPLRIKTETGNETLDLSPLMFEQLKTLLRDPASGTMFYLRD